MHRLLRGVVLMALAALAGGCSTMGIYDSEFSCPNSYNGRCISLQGAHDLASKGEDGPPQKPEKQGKVAHYVEPSEQAPPNPISAKGEENPQSQYKDSLYKRLDSLVREPKAPIVAPAQVMRVLLLPYKSEANELYMLRYVYFFVDDPKWVVSDMTAMDEEEL